MSKLLRIVFATIVLVAIGSALASFAEDAGWIANEVKTLIYSILTVALAGIAAYAIYKNRGRFLIRCVFFLFLVFLVLSQFLNLTDEIRWMDPIPILGRESPLNNMLEHPLRILAFGALCAAVCLAIWTIEKTNIELKQAEKELRHHRDHLEEEVKERTRKLWESEERYRLLADNVTDLIWDLKVDTGFNYLSPSVEAFLGYRVEEAMPLPLDKILTPSSYEIAREAMEEEMAVGRAEPSDVTTRRTMELEHVRKDGSTLWAEVIATYLRGPDGRITNFVGITRDITERKRGEEALRAERDELESVFAAMDDGVYIVNQEYDIEYTNPVLVAEFGPYEGRKCHAYFHDREDVCPWCQNLDVFAGKTVRWEWTSPKSGKTYDLLDTPLTNADGSISKLEIFRDITERKRSEEKLHKTLAQLVHFNKAAVGRELRMVELKREVNALAEDLGETVRYDVSFAYPPTEQANGETGKGIGS